MSLQTSGGSSGITLTLTGIKALSGWFRITAPSATAKTWWRWSDETVQDKQNHMLRTNTAITANNYVKMQSTPGTLSNNDLGAGFSNVWVHLYAFDDAAGNTKIGIRLDRTVTHTTFTKTYTTPSDMNSFSALFDGANGVDFSDANSRVSALMAWSTPPSETILARQAYSKGPLVTSGLVSLLRCNLGDTIGTDQSGAGNNWTLTGSGGLSLVQEEPFDLIGQPETRQPPPESRRGFIFVPRQYVADAGSVHVLRPIAATPVGTSWQVQEAQPQRRLPAIGEPAERPQQAITALAVGTSWQAPPADVVVRRRAPIEVPALPIAPAASMPALTWISHSPMLLRSLAGTDGGAGGISPLNPTFWFPDVPDRGVRRRISFEAPGAFLHPLAPGQALYFDASWVARRRPTLDGGSGFGERPLFLQGLAWTRQEDRPVARRVQYEDRSALALAGLGAQDLSWALQALHGARFRPSLGGQDVQALLPAFQAQAPSWLPQPADVVRRDVKPEDRGSGPLLTAMAQVQDLSWAIQGADPARRRSVIQDPSMVPVGTAVVLSPWGWIPEAEPARKGRKVVDPTPVSALIPPAIFTAMPWGWLPEGPARPAPRVVRSELASWLVQPLSATPVTSWFPDVSDRPARGRRVADLEQALALHPLAPSSASWYPGVPDLVFRRSPARAADQAPILPGLVAPWGWAVDPGLRRLARRHDGGFSALVDVPVQAGLDWLVDQAQVVAARQRRAGEAVTPIQALAALSPTSWFPWSRDVVAPRPRPQGVEELALLPVVLVPLSAISWLAHDPGRAAPRVLMVLDWAAMPLSAGEAPRVPSLRYALFPALSTMLVAWEDD
jgi:hypothetical protein